jgi:hypothetical protein
MKTLCILATLFVGVTTQAYERPHFSAHIQFKNIIQLNVELEANGTKRLKLVGTYDEKSSLTAHNGAKSLELATETKPGVGLELPMACQAVALTAIESGLPLVVNGRPVPDLKWNVVGNTVFNLSFSDNTEMNCGLSIDN